MKTIPLGPTDRQVSALVQGCMTFGALDQAAVDAAIGTAIDAGITMFDHADVYRAGASEARFGDWLVRHAGMRDDIIIQSKCGIRPDSDGDAPCQRYDFSRAHILASVEGSLARLRTDHLDVLLFHRPDALMEVEEVAATCADLRQAGKVRHFGVSNQGAAQMKLMEQAVGSALVANQLELNIIHNGLIDYGIRINRPDNPSQADGCDALEYCRLHAVTLQAWSPLCRGLLGGRPLTDAIGDARMRAKFPLDRLVAVRPIVERIATEQGLPAEAVILGWLLRHPAKIQVVIGTTKPARIAACVRACDCRLSREQWYELFTAGRGERVP